MDAKGLKGIRSKAYGVGQLDELGKYRKKPKPILGRKRLMKGVSWSSVGATKEGKGVD